MKDLEHRLQCMCVRWFNLQHASLRGTLFAVPNGGQRNALVAAKLKDEGVTAGVADLLLLVPNATHHALCIEMKTEKGRQSEKQKEWQALIEEKGYRYEVVRNFEEITKLIEEDLQTYEYKRLALARRIFRSLVLAPTKYEDGKKEGAFFLLSPR